MREQYEHDIVCGAYAGYMGGKDFFIELSEYDGKYHVFLHKRE